MEQAESLLKLTLSPGLGAVTINRLLDEFGCAGNVLGASEEQLKGVKGVKSNQIAAILEADRIDPRPELDIAARHGVNIVTYDDPQYPPSLRNIYDPPVLLYVRGEIKPADNIALAIVGTRKASRYAREQSERFGSSLARAGFSIISGLARGVDSFAHKGCLEAGGRTLAIIGSGLTKIYPEENRDLAAEIATSGAVISEFAMEVGPSRENFPRRNRIIAGISLGVLVVEAPERSGALITARQAGEMGKEIFALPGRVD
jgi:DNA processing protein